MMDSVNYLADLKLDQFAGSQGFREESLQAYLQMGLPNNKNENWKYTDLKFLENLSFQRGSFSEDVPKVNQISIKHKAGFLSSNHSRDTKRCQWRLCRGYAIIRRLLSHEH